MAWADETEVPLRLRLAMRVVARPERAEKSEKFYRFIGFWSAPELCLLFD